MSRIGKRPVPLPQNVQASIEGQTIRVKGPKGELERRLHPAMQVAVENGDIVVRRPSDEGEHKALHGLTRTLVANMVEGVDKGFQKQLEIVGVGYRAEVRPYGLQLALGYSHPVEYRAPKGIRLTAPQPTAIVVEGADKELVGQVAAAIRAIRKPEPYKGKGIRYEGERIIRKGGKAAKAAGA